ncbi:YihY/virulence factor BrkB family protein [Halorarum salinum]|uniref:YihY/virulence factor BrkB family protein n=1 Tax=Halorarum salinum TaxID=2743089 RepID=A0A7D5LC98_9EURY|nr:YihY/virulence factor BrkB family protein [Halobaculum salinum]QLG63486.1 YihY/virulence factor BrkB family protein [Halobaculum salinum]
MDRPRGPAETLRAMVAVGREEHVGASAASLGYYAFNALLPLLLLVVATFSAVGAPEGLPAFLEQVAGVSPERLRSLLERLGGDAPGRARAVALALLITGWSGLRMFRALDGHFAALYGERKGRSAANRLLDSALVLATVSVGLAGLALGGAALAVVVSGVIWVLLGPALLFAGLVCLFVPMYYLLAVDTTVRQVLPGAAFAAGLWTVSMLGFRLYFAASESVELYGLAGAVLLVLTWLYVAALALLLGVVLNALLAGRVDPDRDWLPYSDAE